jgi:hypothetical protein
MPRMQNMLLQIEGLQCATSLDLNVGCCHIEINPDHKKSCTAVFPFGKFEHQ